MYNNDNLKTLYIELCQYKYFDYYNTNYKNYSTDKITKWYFYNNDNDFCILSLEQIISKKIINNYLTDIINRNWYIACESKNFISEHITDIFEYYKNIKNNLVEMNENYTNNIKNINEIVKIIGKYQSKNYTDVIWKFYNIKKSIDYIKIHVNLFLNNELKNIKIIKKSNNKSEKEELYNINELILYLQNISKDIQNQIKNDIPELINLKNLHLHENNEVNEVNQLNNELHSLSINDNFEIASRKYLSNKYKNLFIKKKLINRLSIQTCKSINELTKYDFY
jgi:hypothetical protein